MEDISPGDQNDDQVTEDLTTSAFLPDLFQDQRGLYLAPVRHHSPACAWALATMIREIKPAHVLIEEPVDLEGHIPHLLDAETVAPVALVSITEGENRLAAYYPFTDHSPEYVAMREAEKIGATIRFIDLPTAAKNLSRFDPNHPIAQDESPFDSSDYIDALCRRLACRDGFELWDHLFEARLGTSDWRSFFTDCGTYCAGVRAATPEAVIDFTGDADREAHMSSCIAEALDLNTGPVLVVVGGFHAPALTTPKKSKTTPSATGQSYLIRYGYGAMDALSGYGAGLPQPGYYDTLWQMALEAGGSPDWALTSAKITDDFAAWLKARGRSITVPARVEALRVATGLAAMRGRDGALRHDLMDGLTTALVKGESGHAEIWSEWLQEYLKGTRLGDVPASAGSPPLVEDARERAKSHRFDLSDGTERRRKLDIRRKASQLDASRFLHAMSLLETGFARRQTGPDYVHDAQTELLFEEWTYAWSPAVEGHLIEVAVHGNTLPDACLSHLVAEHARMAEAGNARDLARLVDLFVQGILAGLGTRLAPFLDLVSRDIRTFGTFDTVAMALRRLQLLAHAHGPLRVPKELDVGGAEQAAFQRLVYLCDDLPKSTEEDIPKRLDTLRLMNEVLSADREGRLNRTVYDEALVRAVQQDTPPEILGAVLASCVLSGQLNDGALMSALQGSFRGVVLQEAARIGVLRGMISTAPQLLWQKDGVLALVDQFIRELDEAAFIELLPHLRLAFTALNPRETDRLAELLGALHGVAGHRFTASHTRFTAHDLERGLAADAALREELTADGLGAWIEP